MKIYENGVGSWLFMKMVLENSFGSCCDFGKWILKFCCWNL
jgi:hypothetical protein